MKYRNNNSFSSHSRCAAFLMSIWLLLAMTIASTAVVAVTAMVDDPPATSLLRGSPWEEEERIMGNININININSDNINMEALRRLVQSRSTADADRGEYKSSNNSNSNNKTTSSSQWSEWHTQWSSLSESDLAAMAYDASPLQNEAHQAWGAAYVAGRRANLNLDNYQFGQIPDESAVLDETGSTAFLRGKSIASSSNSDNIINNNEHENSKDAERQLQSSWTMHTGPENDPIGGLDLMEIEQMTASASQEETETEAERQELEERLAQVMEATQALNAKHARYDTNEEYSYSNPNNTNVNSNSENNNNEPGSMNDMTAFSHTAASSRQRLLTGSYAAWQWYDRTNLATPLNLNLNKVSRVNYAFFQADAEGYVFGTDSWADPNVLFGPYEFAMSSDRLPEECRGGRGRNDGKTDGMANAQEQPDRVDEEEETDAGSFAGDFSSGKRRNRRAQTTLTTDEDTTASNNNNNNNSNSKDPPCTYFEQCHRNFPNSKSCNIHKYKEGLIYRAHTSGAQIYPSIGGWTLSGSFPTIAADITKRKQFAQECVGLIRDYGFDGIDIDWEYPGYEPHGGSPRDRDNFNKLLLEIRAALTDYQMETGDEPLGGGSFGLTAALPCGPVNIDFLDVGFLSKVLDGMNLMTFDFHNQMEPVTGVNSPLYDQEWDQEPGLSVDGCVKNYYESGAGDFAGKIIIGVPFYGKTFSYATELNNFHSNTNGRGGGMVDQGNWPVDLGTPVYYNILDKMSKGGMLSKRHEPTKTQYAYFKDGSGLVTYDDPQSVCDKADYVNKNLLGGLFVWEMSGDLMETLETPLLDSINRKLEETNFDCRSIASPEDGAVIGLPPPAPKGPAQIERREDESIVTSIIDHLDKAEDGTLDGAAAGSFTREVFVYRTWDGRLFPSYVYRYPHFLDALRTMSTVGVDGDLFYLGFGQEVVEAAGPVRQLKERNLQASFGTDEEPELGPTEVYETSLVYGLVNVALYLSQAMTDSIIHDACDELNIDYLPSSSEDNIGLEDGNDHHRFPISNACGQFGRNYQDERCGVGEEEYDCARQMNAGELREMETYGTSRGHWPGAPGPFYCGPKEVVGSTGFWDAMVGREVDDETPTPNDVGRTEVEGCCWWGRGSLSIRGTCLYGKLNYHLGAYKEKRDGEGSAMFPDIDFCRDPGQICTGLNSIPLRWISGMYAWMENVQAYDEDGWNYNDELTRYVNENLASYTFFERASNIHVLGCHDPTKCTERGAVKDMDDRLRAFEKVLGLFGLQFGSHAEPEPPFRAFAGQQQPTPPPTVILEEEVVEITPSPTQSPIQALETVIVPVNVFLTGVPEGKNMTNDEQQVFETLMYDLLIPRLGTVDVEVLEVIIDSQNPYPDFIAESSFDSQSNGGGDSKPVLQVVTNVTVRYSPPPPQGLRDWSIYIKSWVESFGNTMVEIYTSPKHIQHPQTTSKFWDDLVDVSATNVDPPNTEPTGTPTPAPTYIIYPENSSNTYIWAGVGGALGLALCCCCCFFCYKLRQYRQLQADAYEKSRKKQMGFRDTGDDEESRSSYGDVRKGPQAMGVEQHPSIRAPLQKVAEEDSYGSEESASDSEDADDSSSSDDDDSSNDSEDSSSDDDDDEEAEETEDEESQYTYDDETASKSQGASSAGLYSSYAEISEPASEDLKESATSSALPSHNDQQSVYSEETGSAYEETGSAYEEESAYTEEQSQSTYDDTATRSQSQSVSTGIHSNYTDGSNYTEGEESEDAPRALRKKEQEAQQEKEYAQFDKIVERILANDPTLKQIVLDDRKEITGFIHSADSLWNALVGNTHVERLSLRGCNITDEEVASLSLALVDNTSVTHVWLGDNDITSEGVEYLIATLESNESIVHLELSDNPAIDPSLQDDVRLMLEPRETLYKSGPSQDMDVVAQLMERVRDDDPTLVDLNLCDMNVGTREDAMSLFDALAGNTHVKTVDLSSNEIDDDCVSSISLALIENMGVTTLNLANNAIYSEGAEYLIGTLESNPTLLEIHLSGNIIDHNILEEINTILDGRNNGSMGTSKASRGNNSIKFAPSVHTDEVNDHTLDKKSPRNSTATANRKKPSSARTNRLAASIRSLRANDPSLIELNLNGIDLVAQSSETETLIDALANNTTFTKVIFDDTGLDDMLVATLSLALVDNRAIEHLSLRNNQITSEGCEYILGTLDSNTTITHLDLSGNLIDQYLLDEISAIVSSRKKPKQHGGRSISSMDIEISLSEILQRVKSNDPTLKEVLLDNRHLAETQEIELLFDALAQNSQVRKLSLCRNDIDDSLAAALSLALVDNASVEELLLSDNQITSEGCEYLLGTLDSNTTVSYVDLSGNLIDERLMHEIDMINSSRNDNIDGDGSSRASYESSLPPSVMSADDSLPETTARRGSNVDLGKPPMHEVPEESDMELAKRKAIMEIMRDSSIPMNEKNQRIIELQQKYYVPKDENVDPQRQAQAPDNAIEGNGKSIDALIDRIFENDRSLKKVELDGEELTPDDQIALYEALSQNTRVKSLSLINCCIDNGGASGLINCLAQNSTLMRINLEDNQITSNAALDFIAMLKEYNETVQYLELKDNRVRSGLVSQIEKLLEKRRPGYVEPEVVATAAVATASYAQIAPVTSMATVASKATLDDSTSTGQRSGSKSKSSSKSGKSKSRRRRDRNEPAEV